MVLFISPVSKINEIVTILPILIAPIKIEREEIFKEYPIINEGKIENLPHNHCVN